MGEKPAKSLKPTSEAQQEQIRDNQQFSDDKSVFEHIEHFRGRLFSDQKSIVSTAVDTIKTFASKLSKNQRKRRKTGFREVSAEWGG